MATIEDLNKPKTLEVKALPAEDRAPETEEEKKKRVRREQRRKLRVSFKPDDQLTQVKLFTHDPDEELGHDAAQVRDVGDVRSEGARLKEHRELTPDSDDEDGDGMPLIPWKMPTCKQTRGS